MGSIRLIGLIRLISGCWTWIDRKHNMNDGTLRYRGVGKDGGVLMNKASVDYRLRSSALLRYRQSLENGAHNSSGSGLGTD